MWNETCAAIFQQCTEQFEKNNIRYFVFRNHEGLPKYNSSKDVDFMVEPAKITEAKNIVKKIYKENSMSYYDEAVFHRLHCTHGVNKDGTLGIHIDLIGGYLVRGYELYSFEQLYQNTQRYNGFYALNTMYQGIMLLITKIFGYQNPTLSQKYRTIIAEVYKNNEQAFQAQLDNLFTKGTALKYGQAIIENNFEIILSDQKNFDRELKTYARKRMPIQTIKNNIIFLWGRWDRIVFHKKRYQRFLAVITQTSEAGEILAKKIAEKINQIYVDNQKTKIYRMFDAPISKRKIKSFMNQDVHYDKFSLIITNQKKHIKNMVPNTLMISVDKRDNMEEAANYAVKKYMEICLEKIE